MTRMLERLFTLIAILLLSVCWTHSRSESYGRDISAILVKSCFDCHGNGADEGSLKLDELMALPVSEVTRLQWWKVLSNIRAGTMPPLDHDTRLKENEVKQVSDWIKYEVFGTDQNNPDPGKVTVRRLNRREYSNTIRDLMGIDFNADIAFPPDDTGFGFDNNGDALSLSPMLVEKYLAAASQIVDESLPKSNLVVPEMRFKADDFRGDEGVNGDNIRMHKATRVGRTFEISVAGKYELEIVLKTGGSFEFSPQRCHLVCRLDDSELFQGEYGWDESKRYRFPFVREWMTGSHRIEFDIVPIALDEGTKVTAGAIADIDIESMTIKGPADQAYWKQPTGYERFFARVSAPENLAARRDYATEVLRSFALKAFRRPVDDVTLERLVKIAEERYMEPGVSFEAGIANAMIPALASPRFLFRLEDTASIVVAEPYPLLDEFSLASRLSYFLWSTMPDDELLQLAKAGKIREQLSSQVQRMLKDKRSVSLIQNFVGQWLRTRDVETVSIDALAVFGLRKEFDEAIGDFRRRRDRRSTKQDPDPEVEKFRTRFKELQSIQDTFDGEVRRAMRRETEMLFEYIATENRNLVEIVDPGYTFLNEKLAKHYGIPDIHGSEMRRVELPADSVRGGILAQGTMLTVTSNPTRTSPVKRGLFLLENILGTPTLPAPPNVPALEDSSGRFAGRESSLRELLAAHRESALCASCHSRMDPLGLALENFNALGMWRDKEKDELIDTAGQLVTGEKFSDLRELRKIIATERRADFYRCLSQKMLTYAVGRGTEYYDEHTLDSIVEQLHSNDGKFQTLILGIVNSTAFQRQRPATKPSNTLADQLP